MIVLILLILPFIGALLSALAGNKAANKVALLSTVATLLLTAKTYYDFTTGSTTSFNFSTQFLQEPNIVFSLSIDGLTMVMLILTNLLVPIIVLSGLGAVVQNSRAFYALILLMQGALNGVFMASDGFVFYVFWELALIPIYFIALLWGAENSRKITLKFFIYTIAGSLFMLISFLILYMVTGDLSINNLTSLSFKII